MASELGNKNQKSNHGKDNLVWVSGEFELSKFELTE